MDDVELALRCYTLPVKSKQCNEWKKEVLEPDFNRIMVLDTETTADQFQNITFGSAKIYERDKLEYECLFFGEILKGKELAVLKEYAKKHDLPLLTVRDFVDHVFFPQVYDGQVPCIGFNLPFDLSRLAICWGNARKRNEGGFSFKLSEDSEYPYLVIKHIDSKRAFISFNNSHPRDKGNNRNRKGPYDFRGHFLDLRTLVFGLTNESHSLESACKLYKADTQKTHPNEHGKITLNYIEYNRNDVMATFSLFKKVMLEFEKYHLGTSPTKVYSPASIGKSYFAMMGFRSFSEKNPDFPREILGYIMACYYGGRAEVRIRKTPVPVVLIDFLSMYPTMCIIQHLWRYEIASRIDHYDDTENVQKFIDETTLETFFSPEEWAELNAVCLVEPNEDVLPARCKYGSKNTFNIGINHISSKKPVWYSLADVVASKMLTGKSPKILKAIRFEPVGIQDRLCTIQIIGDREIDPTQDDMFKFLMNYRNEIKAKREECKKDDLEYHRLDVLQNNIKIVSNSSSYGIFVEINTEKKDTVRVQVFGNDESFTCERSSIENFGKEFNPIISVLITAAARLVLALTEALLVRRKAMYAFCDTDSMAIPPECLNEIQTYFQNISPYSFEAELFKLEKENFKKGTQELEPLLFYGISAKRYVLYNLRDGKTIIRKFSLHGLGHIQNPFVQSKIFVESDDEQKKWQEQIWQDILDLHYGNVSFRSLSERYSDLYAVSKLSISSPSIMNRFRSLNAHANKNEMVKPFNFASVGLSTGDIIDGVVKPIAPFNKNSHQVVYSEFINYNNGKMMKGTQYWKKMDSIFSDYIDHKESKFVGDKGILERRYLNVVSTINIGKETNNLERSEYFGVQDGDYQVYRNMAAESKKEKEINEMILVLKTKDVIKFGITKLQLIRLKNKIRKGEKLKLSAKSRRRLGRAINDGKQISNSYTNKMGANP